jgi:hypothetical protein
MSALPIHFKTKNKRMKSTLLAALAAALPAISLATPVVAENFNSYTAGALTPATGWTGSANVSLFDVGTGSGGMSGEVLKFTGADNNTAATRTIAKQTGTVVVDLLLNFSAGSIDNNDFLGLWFGSYTGPNIGIKGNCGGDVSGCSADLFVRTTGVGGSFSTALVTGQTVELFAVLSKTGGSTNYNSYSLWVNPTANEKSSLTGADAVFTGNSGLSSFSQIGFRTANLDAGDVILVDNLSVNAVPEPSSFALAGLGLFAAFAARRRASR